MTKLESTARINVDPTNPGQFFACCGLLELADRLRPGAEAWFDKDQFHIAAAATLPELIDNVVRLTLIQLDREDDTSSPIEIAKPMAATARQPESDDNHSGSSGAETDELRRVLRLDWWQDERSGGKEMKVWAGTMESVRIARAMQHAMRSERFHNADLFNIGRIAYDPDNNQKKVEPFYFDARRGPNAHSRDVGFSPNDLGMTTTAFPAVEFLCLVGLERCLPAKTNKPRVFEYYTWTTPLPPSVLPTAVAGLLPHIGQKGYRFENWYRTGQKKHKAFRSAIPISN